VNCKETFSCIDNTTNLSKKGEFTGSLHEKLEGQLASGLAESRCLTKESVNPLRGEMQKPLQILEGITFVQENLKNWPQIY
jgi:hypothetical protein